MTNPLPWSELYEEAVALMAMAYAPYSDFPVGAAALCDDGRIVSGCNVENTSYGLALCAECSLVSEFVKTGGGRLVAFVCVRGDGQVTLPCGRCRQLLAEHGGAELLVATPEGEPRPLGELLPGLIGPGAPRDLLTSH